MYKNRRNLIINTYIEKLNKVLLKYVSVKLSVLTISSLIYVLGFLFLIASNPSLFEIQNNSSPDKCFMMFLIVGISAVSIYHIVLSLYS